MAESDLELDEIATLFAEAAIAVRATQQSLETVRIPVPRSGARNMLTYAVPRADFEIKAQLEKQKTKVVFIFFKKKGRAEVDRHNTRFALVAAPDAPQPPDPSIRLPKVPPAPGPNIPPSVPLPSMEFTTPPFLLTVSEEAVVCRTLAQLLKNAQEGSFADKLPPGEPLKVKDVRKEGEALDSDCGEVIESDDDYQPGSIFFRLDGASPATLVVRATKNAEHAGIYVYRPGARPPVAIYSIFNDDTSPVSYEPIQLLLEALRGWRDGAATRSEAHAGVDPQLGLRFLPRVTHAVWNGYIDALNELLPLSPSSPPAASPPVEARRSVYDLPGVEAQLSYGVSLLPVSDDINNDDRDDNEQVRENHVIETRARVRVERRAGRPACVLSLDAPEFVLSGAARDFMIELIQDEDTEQAEKIADMFDSNAPDPYLRALCGEGLRRDGVILLLWTDDKIPKPYFLVVCSGIMAGVVQDFVFKCELKVGTKGSKLQNIKVVRPMQKSVQLVNGQPVWPVLKLDEYQYWHDFFKAVRRWRTRREPPAE